MTKVHSLSILAALLLVCVSAQGNDRPLQISSHDHDVVLAVHPALHQRFGLAYPVTYIFHCDNEGSGSRAWIRYNAGAAWTQLTEYSAGQFFNGVDAVRFDNDTHLAYVSAALSPASDSLHIRITDADGSPVRITYGGVARFYDNRDAAVLASVDDWKDYTDTMFTRVAKILRSYHLPYTAAVITGATTDSTWAHLQAELDAGDMEVASHTRTHAGWPYTDLVNQITGSRADLIEHLRMPALYRRGETEYVYSFLVPFGETSAEIETTVTHSGYLNTRVVMYQNGDYTPWDSSMGRFRYDGTSKEMGSPYGTTDAAELNAVFDARLAAHGIYHLLLHPYYLVPSREIYSEFFREHMTHISNRTNIWYTTFGHLYVYRLLGDSTVKNTLWPGIRPVITLNPVSQTVVDSTGVSFSCSASGTSPISYQWQRNGIDISGAEASGYSLAMVTKADNGATFRCIVANGFGADTSSDALLTVIDAYDSMGIISDDFNATALNTTLWTVTNPRGDAIVSLTGAGTADAELAVTVPAGVAHDLWTEGMTAPRILQPAPDTELSIEAKFDAPMTASNQTQGLLIVQDSLNLIRVDLVFDQGSVSFFAATFVAGAPTTRTAFEVPLTAPYYLRVRRTGDQWTGYYSPDGLAWTEGVAFSHELEVKQVGAWVGNAGASAPAFTGLIDYIFNTHAPIIGEDGPDVRVPPVISTDPAGATRYEGDSVTFAISATGTAPLSYRWQRNGADVAGGSAASLTISAVARADSGAVFRCIVSNAAGRDTSAGAILHVRQVPAPESGVKISLFVLLQGAMDGDTMRTDLARSNLLPLVHPFADAGWVTDGPDSVGSVPVATVDWVMVEFRSGTADSTVRAKRAALLHNDGAVTGIDGVSPLCVPALSAGNYYIVVRHRNHLPVMSATALSLDTVTTTFDLRSGPSQYFGGEAVALPCGRYGMVAGNADMNKGIGATDLARIRMVRSGTPSYNCADVDLSGIVTASDLTLARENVGRNTRVP